MLLNFLGLSCAEVFKSTVTFIYLGIRSVSFGSSCFIISSGLRPNLYVRRFHSFALYHADILRGIAFASSGIPNFSMQIFSSLYVFLEMTLLESNAGGSPCRGAPTALGSFWSKRGGKNCCQIIFAKFARWVCRENRKWEVDTLPSRNSQAPK